MAISEAQLVTWANLPSSKQHRDTYGSISAVLLDKNAPYASLSKQVYLQGSYGNDTNVHGDSDVDIVVCSLASFDYDLSRLSPPEKAAFQRDYPGTGHSTQSFQQSVYGWLRKCYGSDVNPPKKAVHINEQPHRRSADVLICIEHRQYHRYTSISDNHHYSGVQFHAADGTKIVNFPKEHSKDCTTKHGNTSDRSKPAVRIFNGAQLPQLAQQGRQDEAVVCTPAALAIARRSTRLVGARQLRSISRSNNQILERRRLGGRRQADVVGAAMAAARALQASTARPVGTPSVVCAIEVDQVYRCNLRHRQATVVGGTPVCCALPWSVWREHAMRPPDDPIVFRRALPAYHHRAVVRCRVQLQNRHPHTSEICIKHAVSRRFWRQHHRRHELRQTFAGEKAQDECRLYRWQAT
jgi:hypothetical protein